MTADPALTAALDRVTRCCDAFGDRFPTVGQGTVYLLSDNDNWLAGFWPGLLWLTCSVAEDEAARARLRAAAERLLPTFERRLEARVHITHDLGFLYTLSARAQWQITGSEPARQLALRAAGELAARYRAPGRYLQAWGAVGDPADGGRIIIDTMMNLPLLFWAAAQSENPHLHRGAADHAAVSAAHLVRADASTAHTFFFDQDTGAPLGARTHQGWADESLWARGQAWAVYGFAAAAQWIGDRSYRDLARRALDRFLAELPADGVPTWDLRLPADAPHHPDTSAGAIAAAGALRLARLFDDETAAALRAQADRLLAPLIARFAETRPEGQGLLRGGTYHAHKGWGVNEYFICGDYFYLEALLMRAGLAPDLWGPPAR